MALFDGTEVTDETGFELNCIELRFVKCVWFVRVTRHILAHLQIKCLDGVQSLLRQLSADLVN